MKSHITLIVFLFCCMVSIAFADSSRTFLINSVTMSPIMEIQTQQSRASCSNTELYFTFNRRNQVGVEQCENDRCYEIDLRSLQLTDRTGAVDPGNITLGAGDPVAGAVEPVVGPDGKLWLCREDKNSGCICIPW